MCDAQANKVSVGLERGAGGGAGGSTVESVSVKGCFMSAFLPIPALNPRITGL